MKYHTLNSYNLIVKLNEMLLLEKSMYNFSFDLRWIYTFYLKVYMKFKKAKLISTFIILI